MDAQSRTVIFVVYVKTLSYVPLHTSRHLSYVVNNETPLPTDWHVERTLQHPELLCRGEERSSQGDPVDATPPAVNVPVHVVSSRPGQRPPLPFARPHHQHTPPTDKDSA